MSNYDSSEIRAGILVLVLILASVAFAAGVGGSTVYEFLSGGRVSCETYFESVGTLKPGAAVSVAAARTGRMMSRNGSAMAIPPAPPVTTAMRPFEASGCPLLTTGTPPDPWS